MIRFIAALLAGVVLAAAAPAQTQVVIQLPAKSEPPPRALKYTLLPGPEELTPGNAASRWRQALRDNGVKITEKEEPWLTRAGTSLQDLPRKEVRAFLDRAKFPLRSADQAARRRDCDWEYPPLTLPTAYELPFGEYQSLRELALLLSLRFRLQLAEGKVDEALATLQTGLALGKHVGEGPTVIQSLVGLSITSVMLGHVEELMQQPGAPNFYWALTALPRPLVDLRKPVESERQAFRRSLPPSGELDRPGMTAEQAQKLLDDVFTVWVRESLFYMFTRSEEEAALQEKLSKALTVTALLPQAKKSLIDGGRKAEDVGAMPAAQVVLLWFVDRQERGGDEALQWFTLPPWQALPGLEGLEKKRAGAKEKAVAGADLTGDQALAVLSSRALALHAAGLRVERWLAALRAVEAVRLQTARDGQAPKALKDVTVVPPPYDPGTGKGFDESYSTTADRTVLEVPLGPAEGRRFEMVPAK